MQLCNDPNFVNTYDYMNFREKKAKYEKHRFFKCWKLKENIAMFRKLSSSIWPRKTHIV